MARADLLASLANAKYDPIKAAMMQFEMMTAPPLFSLITPTDVMDIETITKDPELTTKLKRRLELIDQLLYRRGFVRMTQGTNRAVYKFLEDQSFLLKVPISKPGMNDSGKEFVNQHKIKPFCTKCFDISPQGTIGLFERVQDITSKEQFKSVAPLIFDMLYDNIFPKYVLADVGTKFFRNYGLRTNFGPVLLDYPMVHEIDGAKLFCNSINPWTGIPCGGEIDYDAGANFLYCTKCGKQYMASELEKKIKDNNIIKKGAIIGSAERSFYMKIQFKRGNQIINEVETGKMEKSDTYQTYGNGYSRKEKKQQNNSSNRTKSSGSSNPYTNQGGYNSSRKKEDEKIDKVVIKDGDEVLAQATKSTILEIEAAEEVSEEINDVETVSIKSTEELDKIIEFYRTNISDFVSSAISNDREESASGSVIEGYLNMAQSSLSKLKYAIIDGLVDKEDYNEAMQEEEKPEVKTEPSTEEKKENLNDRMGAY